jgi:hypothetical protein
MDISSSRLYQDLWPSGKALAPYLSTRYRVVGRLTAAAGDLAGYGEDRGLRETSIRIRPSSYFLPIR